MPSRDVLHTQPVRVGPDMLDVGAVGGQLVKRELVLRILDYGRVLLIEEQPGGK